MIETDGHGETRRGEGKGEFEWSRGGSVRGRLRERKLSGRTDVHRMPVIALMKDGRCLNISRHGQIAEVVAQVQVAY